MVLSKFVETHLTSLALGTVAVAASFYILYGPVKVGGSSNKQGVVGLSNIGNTCFLNSVLQALASCPTLYFWLQRQCKDRKKINLCSALLKTLAILNNIELEGNPYSPYLVMCALRAHGWVINSDEQDSHEALNAILTTIEEEIKTMHAVTPTKPTHASLLDISQLGVESSDDDDSSGIDDDDEEQYANQRLNMSLSPRLMRGTSLPPDALKKKGIAPTRHAVSRDTSPVSLDKRSHRRSNSGVFSRFGEFSQDTVQVCNSTKEELSPFTGMLTNKLTSSQADQRLHGSSQQDNSPVNYSSFNNITLNLPTQIAGYVTLDTLLQMFISQERVQGAKPDNSFIKQLTFGKLPDCLCLHIQRTGFAGQPYKRHEYVEFPAILSMDKYVYSRQLIKQKSMSAASSAAAGAAMLAGSNGAARSYTTDLAGKSPQQQVYQAGGGGGGVLYNLRAVIVHSGGINSGHYITYRRGPFGCKGEKKWYYTSDSVVRQVSFDEVSRSCAYILFYEKE